MSLVIAETLTKSYEMGEVEVQAIRGVDFNIAKGSFVTFVGPSGSGKTTLLNLIGCLDKPTERSTPRRRPRRLPSGSERRGAVSRRQHWFHIPRFQPDPRADGLRERRVPFGHGTETFPHPSGAAL